MAKKGGTTTRSDTTPGNAPNALQKREKNHNIDCTCEKFLNICKDCEISRMRLNRAIASTGLCSRRKADELILSGQIEVNGQIVRNPATQVSATDLLSRNGSPLSEKATLASYMLYKPVQTVSTVSDPQGRKTVLDLLPAQLRKLRLYPVGRLDYFSEGLLILTNDGDLAFRLTHPSQHVAKIYEVTIRGSIPADTLNKFRSGFILPDGKRLQPVGIEAENLPSGDTLACMELREGVNRQIRRMCDACGLVVLKLKRVAEGSLFLGHLKPGQFRKLTASELAGLRSDS